MKRTVIEIYALLVCFGAMACLSINTGLVIYDVVSLVKPSLIINDYQYKNHQNNNNYWQHQLSRSNTIKINDSTLNPKKNEQNIKRPLESKLTQQRLNSYQSVIEAEKRNVIKGLISELIVILVSLVLFFIHWRFVLNKK